MKKSLPNESVSEICLSVSLLGEDKTGIISSLAKCSKNLGCSILSSKFSTAGDNFALIAHFSGTWHSLAKLETSLQRLAQKQAWLLQTKRSVNTKAPLKAIPYYVQVITLDRVGILFELSQFFNSKNIPIDELQCDTFLAPKTSTLMAHIHFNIYVPINMNMTTLRENFMLYSEEQNLDVVMEPVK